MNKRITSLLLIVVMLLTMLSATVPVYAAAVTAPTFTVEADKATANPGDTITYTVYLQQPDTITAFGLNIIVPAGLTYVMESGQLGNTAIGLLGKSLEFVPENNLQLQWFSSSGDDVSDKSKIELIRFQCTVDPNATINQQYEVTLENIEVAAGSTQNYDDISATVERISSNVFVGKNPVNATSITLAPAAIALTEGDTATIVATLTPADSTDKVTWISSNKSVVTVDTNGKIAAVKKGVAIITAKANNSASATCTVIVSCAHTDMIKTAARTSTCLAKGNNAYYTCRECGVVLKADKATETTVAAETLPFADHSYGTLNVKAEPNHATQTNGKIAHYECFVCHKFFDENKKEKTAAELVIKVTPHGASASAKWKTDANNHWKECDSVNGCVVVIGDTKAAHTFKWKVDSAATEDAEGRKHEECSVCKYRRNENTVIPKLTSSVVKGDINGNGIIDAQDCFIARRAFFRLIELKGKRLQAIDFNHNGVVDARECLMLSRAFFGLSSL